MAANGFEAGFADFLTKPIRNIALLEALVRHVSRCALLATAGGASETALVNTRTRVVVDADLEERT